MRQLSEYAEGIRSGSGACVFLLGEPGIGKSRLIGECVSQAVLTDTPVLSGRASPNSALMPFRPITEALFSLFRTEGPPQDPELAPYRPALARLVPEWQTGGPAGGDSLVVLAEAVLRLLSVVGRERGCLLVLEDMHDADAETLAVVEYLVDNLGHQPVLLLASMRPGTGPAVDLARLSVRRRVADTVELEPLPEPDVRVLAASCLQVEPADLPDPMADRLVRDGDGNPLVIEELLRGALANGTITCDDGTCQVRRELSDDVPHSLVHNVTERADRLGRPARELLDAAAVLGRRFSVAAVQEIRGLDDRSLLNHLSAATDAYLIEPDPSAPDWYSFRHALTADALRGSMRPAERAITARLAADALTALHPGLPGQWCQRVARLKLAAGDEAGAGEQFAVAGRRALADGATASAIALLDQAFDLQAQTPDAQVETMESLVDALTQAGQLDRAFELTDSLASVPSIDPHRRAALHTRLASSAVLFGQWAEAATHVAAARGLLADPAGREAGPELVAPLDVAEAYLIMEGQWPDMPDDVDRAGRAEELALNAVRVAEKIPLPQTACEGWQILALLARRRGFDEAEGCLRRIVTMAENHGLPIWRGQAMLRLAVNRAMRTGDDSGLRQVEEDARSVGALALAYVTQSSIAMEMVLRGDYDDADAMSAQCLDATVRMRYVGTHQHLRLVRAASAAHRADRESMERELAELDQLTGDRSLTVPVTYGLCRAFCALLEENRDRAVAELEDAAASELGNPQVYYLSGRFGLRLLLDVLRGTAGESEYAGVVASSGAEVRWNRQFLLLARAVLDGRAGRPADAQAAFAEADEVSACYPLARNLGQRLVAEAAIDDGWGDPARWLRAAEEYFHSVGQATAAGACRSLLRRAGAAAPQRRDGRERIPSELLHLGLTVREYEVLVLLTDRHGNKDIARQLFISPRTVEKHVASLMTKTGLRDRADLRDYAAGRLAGGPGEPDPVVAAS